MNTFMDRVNAIVQQNQMPQNMMAPAPKPVYPDTGIGALENVSSGAPRQTEIMGQPHMLAYINPQEEQTLRDMGGAGIPGPDGIPAYWLHKETWSSIKDSFSGGGGTNDNDNSSNNDDNDTTSPVNTDSTATNIGAVSNTGQYAGDGFEWQVNPGTNALTRTYTGVNKNAGYGLDVQTDFTNNVQQNSAPVTPVITKKKSPFSGWRKSLRNKIKNDSIVNDVTTETTPVTTETTPVTKGIKNTWKETAANLLTPFDNAKYENGQLINSSTGESLTGGGTTKNVFGFNDTIYGVADDFSNNIVDIEGLSARDANYKQQQAANLESVPPTMTEYVTSFLPALLPGDFGVLGSYFAGKNLQSGIDKRREDISGDLYNLNYDPTGGNTTIGALPATTETSVTGANAYQQYADSMKQAGVLSLGGKQTPDEPFKTGNTPIFEYSDGGYTVVGALNDNNDAINATLVAKGKEPIYGNNDVTPTLSYNENGTVFVPYGGKDPHSIDAGTDFYGSIDPNAPDYNMSKALAETGSYINLEGETVGGDPFETDFPANGAAILNEIGKDHLLKTGDDSKMVIGVDGGGYQYVDGTPITVKKLEEEVLIAVEDGVLDEDILDVLEEGGGEDRDIFDDTGDNVIEPIIIGDDDAGGGGGVNTIAANKLFNRYYKGGSGKGLPLWLQQYASGKSFDKVLSKTTIDGKDYYETPDGQYLDVDEVNAIIVNASVTPETETTTEE